MQLLYYIDGVLQGVHDSFQNIFAIETYGVGTRVIPYQGSLAALPRVGPPNAWEVEGTDTRPYGEPFATPDILIGYSSQVRFDTLNAGVMYASIPVASDRVSQMLIGNLKLHADTLAPTDVIHFIQQTIVTDITAADVNPMLQTVQTFQQEVRTIEANIINDLRSATPTIHTYDEIDALFEPALARTVLYGHKVRSFREYYEKHMKK
jgi:hypothetical protein